MNSPYQEVREMAQRVAATKTPPMTHTRVTWVDKTVTSWGGLRSKVIKERREEPLFGFWCVWHLVTFKLDEDTTRFAGPLDGDETRGWAILLRDDGRLLHVAWSSGREPSLEALAGLQPSDATDEDLAKTDHDWATEWSEHRRGAVGNRWWNCKPSAQPVCPPGQKLLEELSRL